MRQKNKIKKKRGVGEGSSENEDHKKTTTQEEWVRIKKTSRPEGDWKWGRETKVVGRVKQQYERRRRYSKLGGRMTICLEPQ